MIVELQGTVFPSQSLPFRIVSMTTSPMLSLEVSTEVYSQDVTEGTSLSRVEENSKMSTQPPAESSA